MHVLVAGDQLVREAEPRQNTTLTKPVYGGERRAEEDPFHYSERDDTRRERIPIAVKPFEAPLSLGTDGRYRLYGSEQPILFLDIRNEELDEVPIRLRVNVLPVYRYNQCTGRAGDARTS